MQDTVCAYLSTTCGYSEDSTVLYYRLDQNAKHVQAEVYSVPSWNDGVTSEEKNLVFIFYIVEQKLL